MMQSGSVSGLRSMGLRTSQVDRDVLSMAELVRYMRLQRGWTQNYLAKITGLGLRTIQYIEYGTISHELDTIMRLSLAFCVNLYSLVKHDE